MWVDEFVDLIALQKERADQIQTNHVATEALTRSSLIDPMLEYLGWEVHNPAHVIPEFSTGQSKTGYADYALFGGAPDKPDVFVEAKRLGGSLGAGLDQAITYCVGAGVPYFIVTDGIMWSAYETFRPVPTNEKLLFDVDLSTGSAHQHVMELLWLWRGNFIDNAGPTSPAKSVKVTAAPKSGGSPPPTASSQPTMSPTSASWSPIKDVLVRLRAKPGHPAPSAMRFPDGSEVAILTWRDVKKATVNWLIGSGKLSAATCPLVTSRGSHIVHTSPVRATGEPFKAPHQISGLWLDLHWSTKNTVRLSIEALEQLGIDLSMVMLK